MKFTKACSWALVVLALCLVGCGKVDQCLSDADCGDCEECAYGSCQPLVCDTPPVGLCFDDTTLWAFHAQGVCNRGSCAYSHDEVNCPQDCDPVHGVCRDCVQECDNVGLSQCQAGRIRNCQIGPQGCLVWGPEVDCPLGTCADASSCTACEAECPHAGATACEQGRIRTCQLDADDCLVWGPEEDCPLGTCADATACSDCNSDCSNPGDTVCESGAVRTCEIDPFGCPMLSAPQACPTGSCLDAQSCATCTSGCAQLGETSCQADQIRTCEQGGDGCLDWGVAQDCPDDGLCIDPGAGDAYCVPPCMDYCPVEGTRECLGGSFHTCEISLTGCLDWTDFQNCPSGACQDPTTCADCLDECQSGQTQCVATSLETCELGASGCWEWGPPVACPFGPDSYPTCDLGVCGIGCNTGFDDCDGEAITGCEIHILSDVDHCGFCDNACGAFNGLPSCGQGACAISCNTDWDDCNGINGDGCEISLRSDSNCGACGMDCLGGGCEDGDHCRPVVLASNQDNPVRVAFDDTHVYWTNEGTDANDYFDGSVYKVPRGGGTPVALATNQVHPYDIAVDQDTVYFTILGPQDVAYSYPDGAIKKVPKAGGSVTTIASSQATPRSLVVHPTDPFGKIYWTNGGTFWDNSGTMVYNYDGAIWEADKDGGQAVELDGSESEPIEVVMTNWGSSTPNLYWLSRGSFPSGAGRVKHMYISSATTLTSGYDWPEAMAYHADYLYFSEFGGGLYKIHKNSSSGTPTTLVPGISGGFAYEGIGVDDDFVYYTDTSSALTKKVPVAGGEPITIVTYSDLPNGNSGPRGLMVDDEVLFWVAGYSGNVLMLAK